MKRPTVASLALAIATGRSIASWYREAGVKRRTAYRMASSSECRQLVQEIRRRSIDRAIGVLAKHAARSADEIAKLATKGQSEAIRLSAARAVLADLLAVQGHAELEAEIRTIKQRLDAQEVRRNAKRKP